MLTNTDRRYTLTASPRFVFEHLGSGAKEEREATRRDGRGASGSSESVCRRKAEIRLYNIEES